MLAGGREVGRVLSGRPTKGDRARPGRKVAGSRGVRPALVLQIPSQTDFLALVRDVTKKMAESAGFDGTEGERLALAVDQATTNVLEHAYGGASDRTVEIRFEDRGPALCIDVVDDSARRNVRCLVKRKAGPGGG